MENNFEINYQDKTAAVEYQNGSQPNEYLFTVQLPDGPLKIQCKKDNEGAYRWLDEDGSTSETTKQVGVSIETYLMEQHITL